MTAVPELPGRLLTVDAYVALGEDDRYRTELQEGVAHEAAVVDVGTGRKTVTNQ